MIRLFVPYLNLLVAVLLKALFQGDVSVVLDAPIEVVAGTEFEVEITINKGDLASFSRLQQSLPAGLTARSSNTSNADFTFKNKQARFMWMRMPEQNDFTVSYTVKIDQRLKGEFSIDGKFSYIEDNERRSVSVKSEVITILPSPDIDPNLIVDIVEYEKLVIPNLNVNTDPKIACIRQLPRPAPDGNGYIVNVLVSKERKEKFAKIEETIPEGFVAEELEERDAIFTFEDGTAKYLWLNLPASSFFIVSYRLVPDRRNKKAPQLNGTFSYLEEDKTISIDITQTEQDIASVKTPEDLSNLLLEISSPALANSNAVKYITADNTKSPTTKPRKKDLRANRRYLLEPEDGIYYRVQLAAGRNPVNIKRYFRQYKLEKEVRKEIHDGWHKYSIGSFADYKVARDYRVHVWNTTIIDDAFVAAYNDGSRITVQEALMIANQKWYK